MIESTINKSKQTGPKNLNSSPLASQSTDESVMVDTETMLLGHAIKFPIYDQIGVLLLAQGAMITPSFRRRLQERGISKVCMHSDDAEVISLIRTVSKTAGNTKKENCKSEVTQQLGKTINNGLQFVTNNGDATRDALVDHGSDSYSSDTVAIFEDNNQQQCRQLSELMSTTFDPKSLSGDFFREVTCDFLDNLCEDFDCVNSLAANLAFDDALAQHCHRMAILGMSIAIEMGLNNQNVCRVGVTGMLHDWGMLKMPSHLRNPPRPLNESERLELQKHVIYSVDLLEQIDGLPTLVPLVSYQVHEQVNGKGYPRGRTGNSIHLFARILHVAHCYIELTSATAFREAIAPYEATMQMFRLAKNGVLDPVVLRAMLRTQSLFPVGSQVMLSTGSIAKVIRA
ncbi:MAG: HD domain-containing protein, partial [Planctomycetaceae bacterium]|nr:HD domain-containing protein [Planctomycetaceae bacterium]